MYGNLSELEAMGVDPNQLLGLVTHQKEEEKDKEQFLIKDDQEPEDESMYPLSPPLLNEALLFKSFGAMNKRLPTMYNVGISTLELQAL